MNIMLGSCMVDFQQFRSLHPSQFHCTALMHINMETTFSWG